MSKQPSHWFVALCKGIAYHNSGDELKKLCESMEIPYDQYDGMSFSSKTLEIGGFHIFFDRLDKVFEYLRETRPRSQPVGYHALDWDDIEAQGKEAIRAGDPLHLFHPRLQSGELPKKGKYMLWYHELGKILTKYYDKAEFRQMCLDLNINYDRVSSVNDKYKGLEAVLIAIGQKNGIKKLVHYCRWTRPQIQPLWVHSIPWDEIVERADKAFKEGNPLHDPILAKHIRKNG